MDAREYSHFEALGVSFWAKDPIEVRKQKMREILGTVVATSPNESEEWVKKSIRASIQRAKADSKFTFSLEHSLFSLSIEERFLLFSSHVSKFSYRKMSEILEVDRIDIEKRLWNARIKFFSSILQPGVKRVPYPSGPSKVQLSCPDYVAERPWTQRLLDDELEPKSLHFLSNHLMQCSSCSRALQRAREAYFLIESELSFLKQHIQEEPWTRWIHQKENESKEWTRGWLAISRFFRKKEVIFMLLGLGAFYLYLAQK